MVKLTRESITEAGVFSILADMDQDGFYFHTIEHAYKASDLGLLGEKLMAKLPLGTYTCVRGEHRLHPDKPAFETFEITGVPGHTGVLFHTGNTEWDSKGCVLVGMSEDAQAVHSSKNAFAKFMSFLTDINEFQLLVE